MTGHWSSDGRVRSMLAAAIALAAFALTSWAFRHDPWPHSRFAGMAVSAAGVAMMCVARYQLGASFSLRAKARQLVTSGVYARLRNPIYVGGELVFIGMAMFLMSWWPLVVVAVTVPMQMARARRESTVLHAAFGDEYDAYRRSTWF